MQKWATEASTANISLCYHSVSGKNLVGYADTLVVLAQVAHGTRPLHKPGTVLIP